MSPSQTTLEKGKQIEQQVASWLVKTHGWRLLHQNFRCRYGEIDLILLDQSTIVFVEVKFRGRHDYGGALWSLSHQQRKRIYRSALFYLQSNARLDSPARIDFVGVEIINNTLHFTLLNNVLERPG